MRVKASLLLCLLFAGLLAFGQVGNSTITGIVTDPAGAVVAGAAVEAKNTDTGVVYTGVSTGAGNYTIPDLPVGTYAVTVTVKGFKTYSHTNLGLAAASTLKEDIALQVGAATESVTVTAEASLLKTETGDLAANITIGQLDDLPLLGIGAANSGTSGYRNPYNVVVTLPGVVNYSASNSLGLNVNGLGTQSMLTEGQESTTRVLGNGGTAQYYQIGQAGVDSIQEVSYQTSNYAPEFGTASSVVINQTMKSGTNKYHGSGYDYFVNEDLNAGDPYSISGCLTGVNGTQACSSLGGDGGKYQPRNRRNDFGGTLGGPVFIPHIYNGHNKTFWFFSYEQYAETDFYTFGDTVATPNFINGNFSQISPNGNCSLCATYGIPTTALGTPTVQKDPLGNLMYANEIYNPASRGVVASSNLGYASPFVNNQIPMTMFDPITVDFQNLISKLGVNAQNANLLANYTAHIPGVRYSAIPSIKIDHNLDAKDKLSFFYSENNTVGQISSPLGNADGLPIEIGQYRGTFIPTYTERLNYDRTLAPTLLLHLGVGYIHTSFSDKAPFLNFDPSQFGLTGFEHDRQFPSVTGMCVIPLFATACTGYGGMQNIGTDAQIQSTTLEEKPTYNVSLTWIQGKHSFKFGGSLVEEATNPTAYSGVTMATGTGPTSEPFTPTSSFNGFSTGFGYASWLLGDYTTSTQTPQTDPRDADMDWSLYAQDSWKVTRKLTVDYGLRWDLFGVEKEQYGRLGQFDETLPNANAGGHPGSTIFASNCGCSFYQPAYPFALGPRLGVAYQIDPKTVFRAGWGITYALTENLAGGSVSTNGTYNTQVNSPAYVPAAYQYVNDQAPGFIQQPVWPVSTNIWPVLGTTGSNPAWPDQQENRPPRVNQWSAGIQREVTRSLVIEAEYVANRAAWLTGALGGGTDTHVSPATYAAYGLYPYPGTGPCASGAAGVGTVCEDPSYSYAPAGISCTSGNDCDRALLSQAISSTAVQQKIASAGIASLIPYSCAAPCGFATSNALSTIVGKPFPQFAGIAPGPSPTGNSKYDSLQTKATKRFSHGLQASGFFTWAQGFTRATRQDYFNPASTQNSLMAIPPRTLSFNFIYTTPKAEFLNKVKFANSIIKDWQLGGFANYQSAGFLAIPTPAASEFLGTQDVRVAGQPLYLKNVNGQINPWTDVVLNPAAWAQCPVNSNCGNNGDYLKGFRGRRKPSENANIGRNFRIKERMNLQVRGEFVNIFNRTQLPSPSTSAPQNAIARNALGIITSGYGTIAEYNAPNTAALTARTGTLIARFSF